MMGIVAAGNVAFSISQFSVVWAGAVNWQRLDLLLQSNMIDMGRGYGGRGQGTGVGSIGLDEEATVDMGGRPSSCFHVVVVQ